MPGTPTCGPFGESGTYTTPSGQTIQGTRGPFSSQFAAVTYQKTIGNSAYNALDVSLRHAGPSLELQLGYSYGKSLDESSSLAEAVNPLNPSLSRALSAFDMRQNLVASYDWKLPLGNAEGLVALRRHAIHHRAARHALQQQRHVAAGHDSQRHQQRWRRYARLRARQSSPSTPTRATAARRSIRRSSACRPWARSGPPRGASSTAPEWRISTWRCIRPCDFPNPVRSNCAWKRSTSSTTRSSYGAAAVNGNIGSASFGQIVSAQAPREIQLAARFRF